MSRAALLRRRAGARRALLGLVGVLAAAATTAVAATLGVVRVGADAAGDAARPAVVAGAGVPVALLVLAAVVTFAQVGSLIAQERADEAELLVSRGAAPGQLAAAGAVEVGIAAVAGALAGAVVALGGLMVAGLAAEPAIAALSAAGVAALAVLVVGGAVAAQGWRAVRRSLADRSGRVRRVASGGLLVVTVLAAAVCLARLLQYGSPLVSTERGARTDALAAAAPALVLAVLAVGAAGLLGGGARVVERLAARRPGTGVLTVRAIGRRLVAAATSLVLLVLAGGAVALAGFHAGTTQRLSDDVTRLAAGADVRVTAAGLGPVAPGTTQAPLAEVAGLGGVSAAIPVLRFAVHAGRATSTLLGLPADRAREVLPDQGDREALVAALGDGGTVLAGAPPLPPGTRALRAAVELRAEVLSDGVVVLPSDGAPAVPEPDEGPVVPPSVTLTLWLASESGELVAASAGTVDPATPAADLTREITLDEPLGEGWHLAAVDAAVDGGSQRTLLHLALGSLEAETDGGAEPVSLDGAWVAADAGSGGGEGTTVNGAGLETEPEEGQRRVVRLEPEPRGEEPLPVALARPLAATLGLGVGDPLDLTAQGGVRITARVAAVVDAIPGALAPNALAADLAHLRTALLHTQLGQPPAAEVWAAGRLPADAALDAEVVTPASIAAEVDASAPVRAATWVAACGTALLALSGVVLAAAVALRSRRGEVLSLRATGLGPREQGRSRAAEVAAVGVVGLVAGLAGGTALAALTVPRLARTGVVGLDLVPDAQLTLAALPAAVAAAVLALGLAGTCALVAARVAAQVRDTEYREEVR